MMIALLLDTQIVKFKYFLKVRIVLNCNYSLNTFKNIQYKRLMLLTLDLPL